MNSGILDLLANPPKPTGFVFSKATDRLGLYVEHPSYVKANCKDCYGRGSVTFVRPEDDEKLFMACHCVNKGYVKVRLAMEQALLGIVPEERPKAHKELVAALYKK